MKRLILSALMVAFASACSTGGGVDVSAAPDFPASASLASQSLTAAPVNVGTPDGLVASPAVTGEMAELARARAPSTTRKDRRFKRLLNQTRRAAGAKPVTYNKKLDKAAQRYARDLLRHDYFSHTGRDGSDVADRVKRTGYKAIAYGENLGQGQRSDRQIRKGWVNSPAHYDMMTAKSLKQFGLGVAGRGANTRWVLVMATPRGK